MKSSTYETELKVLKRLAGRFAEITNQERKNDLIRYTAKTVSPDISEQEIVEITEDINNFAPIGNFLADETIEDIMINNTSNVFVYSSKGGQGKSEIRFENRDQLDSLPRSMLMKFSVAL